MKKILFLGCFLFLSFASCDKEIDSTNTNTVNTNTNTGNCGWYNGKPTYKGINGGCYYWNSNGNKTYVDHQYCPC